MVRAGWCWGFWPGSRVALLTLASGLDYVLRANPRYDRHELRLDARRQLDAIAGFRKEHPEFEVALDGHADERGTVEYNLALGQERAVSARSYLDSRGVVQGRLQAKSYGKERPLCTESQESCWQQNRRVHFEIVGRTE